MNRIGFVWGEVGLGETGVSVLSRDPATVARVRCRSLAVTLLNQLLPDITVGTGLSVSKPGIGQPVFEPNVDGVCLSLAHSEIGGRWICAAAVGVGCRVGIDVEGDRRVFSMPRFQERYLNELELEALSRAGGSIGAMKRLWVAKEAIGKALGVGIQAGFVSIDCRELLTSGGSNIPHDGHTFSVNVYDHPEWALGLASDAVAEVREFTSAELDQGRCAARSVTPA